MRVGIDISGMHPLSRSRGIGFYTENLVKGLNEFTNLSVSLIEDEVRGSYDLIHYPFFDLFVNTLKIKMHPTIVTVHDVIPLIFPEHFPPGIRGSFQLMKQKSALKKVDTIITDSHCSKDDIVKYLGVDSAKVFVVPLAPPDDFGLIKDDDKLREVKERYNLPNDFALYSGGVNWNKNLPNLTQACLDASLDLVLVGKGFETKNDLHHAELEDFRKFINKFSNNRKIHMLGFIPVHDLAVTYNLALVLLQPSRYEGFGLPILEAQASGLATITSNISSMPEVAGEGAILVNPDSIKSISEALKRLWKEKGLRKSLIEKGFRNVKNYSWRRTAMETAKIYERFS